MKTSVWKLPVAGAVALLCVALPARAQSLDVPYRENGLRGLGYALFDEEDGFTGSGAGFAYGIGGMLDVGFDFGLLYGEVEDVDSEESRMRFLLRGLLARQQLGFPLTLSLAFTYHLSLLQSDYLRDRFDDYELLRNGRGYSVSGAVWRDFGLSPTLSVRAGLGATHAMERFTTTLASSVGDEDADPALGDYPLEELQRRFTYDGSLGPVFRPRDGRFTMSTIATVQYDPYGALAGGVELGATFVRPQ